MGTDTHFADGLAMMRYGLGIARRAWLEKADILNSLDADALLVIKAAAIKDRRRGPSRDRAKRKRRGDGR
jgi:hypothetical protein